jgi:hypothetical protein
VCLIGAHAATAYAPERMTQDVHYFTTSAQYEFASKLLRANCYRKGGDLTFTTTALGLFGSLLIPKESGQELDLLSSEQPWATEVFCEPAQFTKEGDRVIPFAYLVL